MRDLLLLMMICLLPAAVLAGDYISVPHTSDLLEGGWIELEGDNMVQIPNLSLISPNANLTYPITLYPAYAGGQAISGTFRGPENLKETEVEYLSPSSTPPAFSLPSVSWNDQSVLRRKAFP